MRVSSCSSSRSTSGASMRLEGRHFEVVEADRRVPIVEAEVLVPSAEKGLRLAPLEVSYVVDRPLHGLAVVTLDAESIRLARLDRARPLVVGVRLDVEVEAIFPVLVEPGEDVFGVLPAAQNEEVARR